MPLMVLQADNTLLNLENTGFLGAIQNQCNNARQGILKCLNNDPHYEEESMSLKQLVEREGFKYEEHQVTTRDGYILTMMRIRQPNLNR